VVAQAERIVAVAPDALTAGEPTPGITRETAFAKETAVMMTARVEADVVSGWHHHGDRETFGYVVRGRVGFDFGPGGGEHVDVEPGGFFHVPARLVHREVNAEPGEVVLVFVGEGPVVVNVDAPDPT
jgi:uncharacterized RmlC-like cupin family protein